MNLYKNQERKALPGESMFYIGIGAVIIVINAAYDYFKQNFDWGDYVFILPLIIIYFLLFYIWNEEKEEKVKRIRKIQRIVNKPAFVLTVIFCILYKMNPRVMYLDTPQSDYFIGTHQKNIVFLLITFLCVLYILLYPPEQDYHNKEIEHRWFRGTGQQDILISTKVRLIPSKRFPDKPLMVYIVTLQPWHFESLNKEMSKIDLQIVTPEDEKRKVGLQIDFGFHTITPGYGEGGFFTKIQSVTISSIDFKEIKNNKGKLQYFCYQGATETITDNFLYISGIEAHYSLTK